jgi:hypothetical protein
MHKFYVIIMLLLAAPLSANNGKQHGGGAGPSGEEQLKECRCPKCGNETSKDNKVYCMVKQDKHPAKCGHWICKACQDKMQSDAFWTWSKTHSMKCPVCSKEVVSFVDVYGNAYPPQEATGYIGL